MAKKTKQIKAKLTEQLPNMQDFMGDILGAAENLQAQAEVQAVIDAEKAAAEAQAREQAEAQAGPAHEPEVVAEEPMVLKHVPGDIKEMIGNVTPEARQVKANEIMTELQTRIAYETRNGQPLGSNAGNSLLQAQKHLATVWAAGYFCAVDIDPSFINRSVSGDKRFNALALCKIRELIGGIDGGFVRNKIVRAVLLSLFNFRDAGLPFTMSAMQAAISSSVRVETKGILKHLVRHTVAASTAPTQSSQMSHALQVMGIVTAQTIGRQTTFTLTDTPQVRRLEEVLRAAA